MTTEVDSSVVTTAAAQDRRRSRGYIKTYNASYDFKENTTKLRHKGTVAVENKYHLYIRKCHLDLSIVVDNRVRTNSHVNICTALLIYIYIHWLINEIFSFCLQYITKRYTAKNTSTPR